jgi:DNA-binding NarL/FixJ family response regulator
MDPAASMSRVRLILADDHGLVRAGLRALIERAGGIEIVAEAADGQAALRAIAEHRPELALLNISMPELNGLEVVARATAQHPRTRLIVVSSHADEEYVRRAMALGAAGYLLKASDRDELLQAIQAVARGDLWLGPAVARSVVTALRRGEAPTDAFELLTPRQREVLQLVAEGHPSKAIADRLGVSVKTVESHRAALMLRLGVTNVAGLVRAAIRLGIATKSA